MNSSINIDEDLKERIEAHIVGKESISNFVYRAVLEKVTRMESRDIRAKNQLFEKKVIEMDPVIKQVLIDYGLLKDK